MSRKRRAGIAQLVEQATENRRVPSSNLGPGIDSILIKTAALRVTGSRSIASPPKHRHLRNTQLEMGTERGLKIADRIACSG